MDSRARGRYHAALPVRSMNILFPREITAMRVAVCALACIAIGLFSCLSARAEVGLKKTDTGIEVSVDGKPFTTYIFNAGFKPILWPIVGPTGKEMTRAWPLR